MEAEDIWLDNSCKRNIVEESCEMLPHVGITVLSKTLIIESVNLGDLLALVISSQKCDSAWIANLETDEEWDSLNGVVASVNIVTSEQVVVVGHFPTYLK